MMKDHSPQTTRFFDPRTGQEPLHYSAFPDSDAGEALEPARTNCFAVYHITSGAGTVAVDDASHRFHANVLLFVVPYQYLRFMPEQPLTSHRIEFHANFLCIETFHAESGCSGRLFNDPFGNPILPLDDDTNAEIVELFTRIAAESRGRGLAYTEAALAYLKVLLIVATRAKATSEAACDSGAAHRHPILTQLMQRIEEQYRVWHTPAEYAEDLHLTAKTLGRIVREHLGTTPTDLIRRRILIHAKWELLHTLRPVKEIAGELGYADELYFSRVFRKATGVSPTYFREFETAIRGGSNLSMSSGRPSLSADTPNRG